MRIFLIVLCCFFWYTLSAIHYGDVVFSELMVDPEPSVGLPEVEYLEICNRSDLEISLVGWKLLYGDKSYGLPPCKLSSGEYLVLCSKTSANSFPAGVPVIGISPFPSLLKTGKLMALTSSTNELVSILDYSDRWYGSGFKANGGWSLECIDLTNFSGHGSNWAASTDPSGGTPGLENSVFAVNPSFDIPSCTRLFVPSPDVLEIHFSSFMQLNSLYDKLNYVISPENTIILSATVPFPDSRILKLQLSDALVSESIYQLKISGLYNLSGRILKDTTLSFGLPEKPLPRSLVLNEILFDPLPGGSDYVEFVNVGTKCVDLSDVWLTNRSDDGDLNEGRRLSEKPLPCLPGSYWLLSESPDSVCSVGRFPLMPNRLEIKSFPSMSYDMGNVSLVTTSAEVLDEMNYTYKMHFPLISNPEGVALEKIRPDAVSSLRSNWISANSGAHFGTPGFKNSQFQEIQRTGKNGFYVNQTWITPNNDGLNDRVQVQYELPESCVGSLTVFDLQGRLVRKLANNELLGVQGDYWWDGTYDDGKLAPFGRYILFAEAFTPKGEVFRSRLVLTILF
ncbi:MAG TPA: lamin tail domain-containing protein [Bacteroidales bacterium]|nr:lamin tail domain-containing protein [Bacteroidales bacterium]